MNIYCNFINIFIILFIKIKKYNKSTKCSYKNMNIKNIIEKLQ